MSFSTINNGDSGETVRLLLNSIIENINDLGLDIEFSANASSWHYGWETGDLYIRFSDDFGTTWSDAIYLNYSDTLENYVEKVEGSRLITAAEAAKIENLTGGEASVYKITLPSSTTIAGRIAAASEGTDYPTGWVLAPGSNAANLEITHSISKRVANVNVFYLVTGTEYRQLINFNNAYSGITTPDTDTLLIEALTTIQKEIQIFIVFE